MTRKKHWRWLMRFRHSRVNVDGHGIGQIAWLATAATMRRESDTGYELVAFCQC